MSIGALSFVPETSKITNRKVVVIPNSNPQEEYLHSITGKDTYIGFQNHYEDGLQF
jgi:hypothetical protein